MKIQLRNPTTLIAAVGTILILATSCKKDRTCTCTQTSTVTNSSGTTTSTTSTTVRKLKKLNKQHANQVCYSITTDYTQNGNSTGTQSVASDCTLK